MLGVNLTLKCASRDVFVSSPGPLWVVVKFAENGCLLDYLRKHREENYKNSDYVNVEKKDSEQVESKEITDLEKIRFAHGIAKGMNHLATMKVGNDHDKIHKRFIRVTKFSSVGNLLVYLLKPF